MHPSRSRQSCLSRATLLGAAVLISAASPIAANAANGTWGGNAAGAWSTASLWSGSVIPGATLSVGNSSLNNGSASSTDVATFSTSLSANRTIATAYAYRLLSGITFNHTSAFSYTVGSQGGFYLSNGGTVAQNSTSGAKTDNLFSGAASDGIILGGGSGGSYTFDASGGTSGDGNTTTLLTIAGTGSIRGTAATAGSYTLNLTGYNVGANTIGAAIANGTNGGTLSVVKSGIGKWVIGATSTATGTVTINQGTLELSAANALSSFSSVSIADASGVSLNLTNNQNQEFVSISGGGSSGGNISLGSLTRLIITGSSSTTLGGVISGAGGITRKAGSAGTLTLTGNNSYTGVTTINAGTLSISTISNGGANSNLGAAGTSYLNLVLGGGTLQFTGSSGSTNRNFTLTAGTTSTIEVLTGGTLTISGAATNTTGNLVKAGAGTLVLSGLNNHTGSITINAGTLSIGTISNAGTASTLGASSNAADKLVLGGGTLQYTGNTASTNRNFTLTAGTTSTIDVSTGGQTLTISGASTGSGSLIKAGAGSLTLSAVQGATGSLTINAGTLTVSTINSLGNFSGVSLADASGANLTLSASQEVNTISGGGSTGGNITLGGNTLTIAGSGTTSFGGIISGTGGITRKTGSSGTLTLTGTNTFTGVVTINAGTLSVDSIGDGGVAGNLGQSSTTAANLTLGGGTLQYTGNTASTNRNFTLTAGTTSTIDVSTAGQTLTMTGASANTNGSLVKTGAGTLVLSGSNAHTGSTTINAGTLSIGTINNGGVAGTLGASSNAAANLVLGGGTLKYTGNTASTDRHFTSTAGTTSTIDVSTADQTLTISGASTGSGNLVKAGAGILELTGSNAHTGSTAINAGTIRNGNASGALPTGTVLTLGNASDNAAGTFDLYGNNQTVAGINTAGSAGSSNKITNSIANSTATLTVTNGGNFAGKIENGGSGKVIALAVTGGNLVLSNTTSDYTGGTTIASGATVTASGTHALGNGNVTVNSGGTLVMQPSTVGTAGTSVTYTLDGASTLNLKFNSVSGSGVYSNWWGQNVYNQSANAGSTYSTLNLGSAGTLDLTGANNTNKISLVLDSGSGTSGIIRGSLYKFTIATLDNISWSGGDITSLFDLDLSNFRYADGSTFDPNTFYQLSYVGGDSLVLTIPEPSTYGLMLGGLALAAAAVRRHRQKKKATEAEAKA